MVLELEMLGGTCFLLMEEEADLSWFNLGFYHSSSSSLPPEWVSLSSVG